MGKGVLGREDPQLNHKRLTCCEIPHQPPLASWDKISPHLTFQCKWSAALTQRTEFSQNVVRWKFSLIECYYYQPIVIFIISCKPGQMLCNRYRLLIASKTYARQHNICQNDIYDTICDPESPPDWQIAAHNYQQQLFSQGNERGERDLGKLEEFQLEFVLDTRNMDGVALLLFETYCWRWPWW